MKPGEVDQLEGESTTRLQNANEAIKQFLAALDVHFWAKDALRVALEKDPVDAANHMEAMFLLLEERMNGQFEADGLRTVESQIDRSR